MAIAEARDLTIQVVDGGAAPPATLACTVEGGPFPLSTHVLDRTRLAVEGTVISARGGVDAPVVIEVSVQRVLAGATTDDTVRVNNGGSCPLGPAAGDRVVVAANADGELVGPGSSTDRRRRNGSRPIRS